jgi:hypothetical protein
VWQQAGGTRDRAQVQRRRQAVPIAQLEETGGRQGDGGDLRHDVVHERARAAGTVGGWVMSAALQTLFKTALVNLIAEQNAVQILLDRILLPVEDRRGYANPWRVWSARPGEHGVAFEIVLVPPDYTGGDGLLRYQVEAEDLEAIREKTGADHACAIVIRKKIHIKLSWNKPEAVAP